MSKPLSIFSKGRLFRCMDRIEWKSCYSTVAFVYTIGLFSSGFSFCSTSFGTRKVDEGRTLELGMRLQHTLRTHRSPSDTQCRTCHKLMSPSLGNTEQRILETETNVAGIRDNKIVSSDSFRKRSTVSAL
jgi:hypothetical protein